MVVPVVPLDFDHCTCEPPLVDLEGQEAGSENGDSCSEGEDDHLRDLAG